MQFKFQSNQCLRMNLRKKLIIKRKKTRVNMLKPRLDYEIENFL